MKLQKWPQSKVTRAYRPGAESAVSGKANAEYDRTFREFIDSITVTKEELAAIISLPELSIQEVKQCLQDGKNRRPNENRSSFAVLQGVTATAKKRRAGSASRA